MRGRSSSAKSRLRSAGYKCNLCGRRLIDAATLERHQKTIHNVSPRDNKFSFKVKPSVQRHKISNKEKEKAFDDLLKEPILVESKPKARGSKISYENQRNTVVEDFGDGRKIGKKDIELVNNGESLLVEKDKSKKKEKRRVEFECPVCAKAFGVYFTAHKHIQKLHSVNAQGKKVAPNSMDLIQPIRVEQCNRCDYKMRSNEQHTCPKFHDEAVVSLANEFVCSGCHQIFVSLKTFDMHVAGLHSDAVDSMFFPTKIEFMNWRLEMERQTNAKYSLYGEYESKKIYRCNYARKEGLEDKSTAYFCPSSMVVQDFSKGIQVHFYNKHYDHTASPYTLSSKYKKYSITSFLKNPNEDSSISTTAYSIKLDDKDLHSQFKKLMDSIVLNAADVDVPILKVLIEKALDMSSILTEAAVSEVAPVLKPAKSMTDKEISEALEIKSVLHKRRRSVDSEMLPKPAKRTRNKSLFNQSDIKMSPKILNTFSLASNSNSDEFKSDNGDDFDHASAKSDSNDKIASIQNKHAPESGEKINKSSKINTRLTNFNESLSFNDSYKDFIDKNFIAKGDKSKEIKTTRNTVKTKLGAFKHTSPRKVEGSEEMSGIKQTTPIMAKVEDAPTSKVNTIDMETSKVNIISVENPNVTITKVSTRNDSPNVANAPMHDPKMESSKITTKANTRGVFSHLADPLQVNISKVNTRNNSSPPMDPLELNITKVKSRHMPAPLVIEPLQRNKSKVNKKSLSSPSLDPLNVNITKVVNPKLNTSKVDTPTLNTLKVYPPKLNTPKVYSGPVTPKANVVTKTTPKAIPKIGFENKVTSKVTFEDEATTHSFGKIVIPKKQIREMKYEVREQENDCNILVLKF